MSKNYFNSGDWNLNCDVCGKKIKASESKKRWDGFIVCSEDYESRHPQDFVRAKPEKISVPFTRKLPDTFLTEGQCNVASSSGYVGLATSGCSHSGSTFGMSYIELLHGYLCSVETRTGIAGLGTAGCMTTSYNIDGYL